MEQHNRNKLTVVKHNDLNQASYKLSLDERRLILSAIALLNPQEKMPTEITIRAKDYALQWNIDETNAYRQLKEARSTLFERKIVLRRGERGRDIRWIYDAEYADGEGYIKISFSPTVAPYLTELKKHFTSYRLAEIKKFRSSHAIRLYELLMQYRKSGWWSENLIRLKEMLGVDDKYPRWAEFRRRVLDPAVREINQSTNYVVDFNIKKRGRKVSGVVFTFALTDRTDWFTNSF